jgi:hypothetical protein
MLLSELRRQALDVIHNAPQCTLCTSGPAGIQASAETATVWKDQTVLLRLPSTTEHVFNLEENPEVVLMAESWQLRGVGEVTSRNPETCIVEIVPRRVQLAPDGRHADRTTIDF